MLVLLLGSWVHAVIALPDNMQDPGRAARSRRLRSHNEDELTTAEATQAILETGVSNFSAIVHRARSPTCHIEQLPASSIGQLFSLCGQIRLVDNCTAEAAPERRRGVRTKATVFRYRCRNDTCIDAWPPALTQCIVEKSWGYSEPEEGGDAVVNNTGLRCDRASVAVVEREVEKASMVGILGGVGLSNAFDCLTGLPDGAVIDSSIGCVAGQFQADLILRLTEGGVVEGDYECIWTGRCRGSKGCCERNQLFEGKFICYLPGGQPVDMPSSALVTGANWAPALFLAGCLTSICHLILSLAW